MKCEKCQHEFCWSCMGDHYNCWHKPGMEKYCGLADCAYVMLYIAMLAVTIVKLISIFKSDFNPDALLRAELLKLMTPFNILYYGGLGLFLDFSIFALCLTVAMPRDKK